MSDCKTSGQPNEYTEFFFINWGLCELCSNYRAVLVFCIIIKSALNNNQKSNNYHIELSEMINLITFANTEQFNSTVYYIPITEAFIKFQDAGNFMHIVPKRLINIFKSLLKIKQVVQSNIHNSNIFFACMYVTLCYFIA